MTLADDHPLCTRSRSALRWGPALRELLRPGRPPRGWASLSVCLLAFAFFVIGLAIFLGATLHGDTARYFGERRLATWVSSYLLIRAGISCHSVARRLGDDAFARFWRIASIGFIYLGIDDLFLVHEQLDWGIHWALGLDRRNPVTDHLDDVIVMGYGVFALTLAYRYRANILALPWTVLTMGAAFVLFAAMAVWDWFAWSKVVEESLKLVSESLILSGVLAADLQLKGQIKGNVSQS